MRRYETFEGVMKQSYEIDDTLATLAKEILAEREDLAQIIFSGMKIGFLTSTEWKRSKGKLVFADTRIVKGVWTAFVPYNFIITFYTRNVNLLNEEQKRILMWHELKHCGVAPNGEYYVVPHDIEDFSDIIEKYGHKWANSIQVGGEAELD